MKSDARKRIEDAKLLTRGTMPLVLICEDKQELDAMKKTAKGMRGIKNLEFGLREDYKR